MITIPYKYKHFITIFFLLSSLTAHGQIVEIIDGRPKKIVNSIGQTCESIAGTLINCIDSIGQKQGYWKDRKRILIYNSHEGYGSSDGCQYTEENIYETLAEGYYKDNEKIGKWKVYEDNQLFISVEKEITFNDDRTIQVENFKDSSIIVYNQDSTVVTGYIYYNGDTIDFNCVKEICSFKFKPDITILNCNYHNFDYEFLRLKIGMYDRRIRELKTKH